MGLFIACCLLPAFAVSFLVTRLLRRKSVAWGLVDIPAERKVHQTPTPLGGGIAIWAGVCVPLLAAILLARWLVSLESLPAWLPADLAQHLGGVVYRGQQLFSVLAAGTVLVAVGLLDDLRNLPWWPRLLIQLAVAVGLVASGVRATLFVDDQALGYLISVMWLLTLMNSFNFLDNMDALSGGIALIAAVIFSVIMLASTSEPRWLVAGVLLVLSGALGGFLCFNWPPASIFMGDAGSYFIGLMLATMTILGTFYDESTASRHVMLAPLCVLAVPLYDLTSVVWIRLREGRSPFHADKRHFSHRLVDLGLSKKSAVMTVHLATLTTGLGGLILYEIEGWAGAWLVLFLVVCLLGIIRILESVGEREKP